eukprot:1859343-Amphidinium_carterae.1
MQSQSHLKFAVRSSAKQWLLQSDKQLRVTTGAGADQGSDQWRALMYLCFAMQTADLIYIGIPCRDRGMMYPPNLNTYNVNHKSLKLSLTTMGAVKQSLLYPLMLRIMPLPLMLRHGGSSLLKHVPRVCGMKVPICCDTVAEQQGFSDIAGSSAQAKDEVTTTMRSGWARCQCRDGLRC